MAVINRSLTCGIGETDNKRAAANCVAGINGLNATVVVRVVDGLENIVRNAKAVRNVRTAGVHIDAEKGDGIMHRSVVQGELIVIYITPSEVKTGQGSVFMARNVKIAVHTVIDMDGARNKGLVAVHCFKGCVLRNLLNGVFGSSRIQASIVISVGDILGLEGYTINDVTVELKGAYSLRTLNYLVGTSTIA